MRLGALAYANGIIAMMQIEGDGLEKIARNIVGVRSGKKCVRIRSDASYS